jgi:hypothetical protein
MEEEKNNQKSDTNSLSSIEDEKLDKVEENKNEKDIKIQDMDLEQLKNYFGDLETKTELSNLESRRKSLVTNRKILDSNNNYINNNSQNNNNSSNNNNENDNENGNENDDDNKSYSNDENSNSNTNSNVNSNSNNTK